MDNSLVGEEQNRRNFPSTAPVSEWVKVGSISVSLEDTEKKKEEEKCHHFSIRGYVASQRGKDIRICAPFPYDSEVELKKQLETLDVPKFKDWRCQSCMRELIGEISQHTHHSSCSYHGKDKKSSVEPSSIKDAAICEPGTSEQAGKTILAIGYPGWENIGTTDEICQKGNANPVDEEQRNSLIATEQSNEVPKFDVITSAVKDMTAINPSRELEEQNSDPLNGGKSLSEDDRLVKRPQTFIGTQRKGRRSRLVSDLLKDTASGGKSPVATNNPLAEAASSSAQGKRKVPPDTKIIEISDSDSEKEHASGGNQGLDLSLKSSYMDVQNKSNFLLAQKKSMSSNGEASGSDGRFIGSVSATNHFPFGREVLLDINRKITERTRIWREKMKNSTPQNKQVQDFPNRRKNVKTTEPQQHPEAARNTDNVPWNKSLDDIPMDIVEMMAKHQHERSFAEAERVSWISKLAMHHKRDFHEMRSGQVQGYGMPGLEQKDKPKCDAINFRNANIKLPEAFPSRAVGNFQPRTQLRIGDRTPQRSAPTIVQGLDAYRISVTGPQQYGLGGNSWSFASPSNMPPRPTSFQKYDNQMRNAETHSQSKEREKGKNKVRDLDLNVSVPNEADIEASLKYKVVTKDVGLEANKKDMLSLDSLSNDTTLPAMQLMSLMNVRTHAQSRFGVANKFFGKPLVPCDHHPKLSIDGRQNIFGKTPFPYNIQLREFSGLGSVTGNPGGSGRQMASAYGGQVFARPQVVDKGKLPVSGSQYNNWISGSSVNTSGVSATIRYPNPRQVKRKGIFAPSDEVVFPWGKESTVPSQTNEPIEDVTSMPEETLLCVLNQNPADFSIPGVGNEYMLGAEDLRPQMNDYSRPAAVGADRRKRQKVSRFSAQTENAESEPIGVSIC